MNRTSSRKSPTSGNVKLAGKKEIRRGSQYLLTSGPLHLYNTDLPEEEGGGH
jgi:hypothetical protein